MDIGIYQTAPENRPRYVGQLQLDLDVAANRYLVIDRVSGQLLVNNKADKIEVHLSATYTNVHELLVLMLDDDEQYGVSVADGVQLVLIDAALAPI